MLMVTSAVSTSTGDAWLSPLAATTMPDMEMEVLDTFVSGSKTKFSAERTTWVVVVLMVNVATPDADATITNPNMIKTKRGRLRILSSMTLPVTSAHLNVNARRLTLLSAAGHSLRRKVKRNSATVCLRCAERTEGVCVRVATGVGSIEGKNKGSRQTGPLLI